MYKLLKLLYHRFPGRCDSNEARRPAQSLIPCSIQPSMSSSDDPSGTQTRQATHVQSQVRRDQNERTQPILTPRELDSSQDPVRHRPTAFDATAILREIALLETGGNKAKSGGLKAKSQLSQIEADWPDLYVFRIDNPDPTYDSLSLAEFVAGYMSIMEEATPLLPGKRCCAAPFVVFTTINGRLFSG